VPTAYAVNCSQPHLNDVDRIMNALITNKKKYIGFCGYQAEEYLARPDAVPGFIHRASWNGKPTGSK